MLYSLAGGLCEEDTEVRCDLLVCEVFRVWFVLCVVLERRSSSEDDEEVLVPESASCSTSTKCVRVLASLGWTLGGGGTIVGGGGGAEWTDGAGATTGGSLRGGGGGGGGNAAVGAFSTVRELEYRSYLSAYAGSYCLLVRRKYSSL